MEDKVNHINIDPLEKGVDDFINERIIYRSMQGRHCIIMQCGFMYCGESKKVNDVSLNRFNDYGNAVARFLNGRLKGLHATKQELETWLSEGKRTNSEVQKGINNTYKPVMNQLERIASRLVEFGLIFDKDRLYFHFKVYFPKTQEGFIG